MINKLNTDDTTHGIILQLPIDSHNKIDENRCTNAICSAKDVDG